MSAKAPVELVVVWHHHQPDYRHPRDRRALLPWVRLHGTKDYLDMALHLERHPRVKATFNFAPSLLDQLEDAIAGGGDALFDLMARPLPALDPPERAELQARARMAPRWARERWPRYHALCERLRPGLVAGDAELTQLVCWFLLAWLDPMLIDAPEAVAALRALEDGHVTAGERDGLLALHARLLTRVVPAYTALAARGQIEISCSPAFHPILPLLIDVRSARRSRADLPVPTEPFAAPEDARWHIEHGLERTARTFGRRPVGMWPSEGSVSPEAAALLAGAGVQWIATDEQVLWRSLGEAAHRERLYRPWRFETPQGPIALLFRDHELSDRIGFVYSTWAPDEAVADFMRQLKKIGDAHAAAGLPGSPVVTVVLDGENCWEFYAEDGAPFLEALYEALEASPDVRTCTPAEILARGPVPDVLAHLHTGSWIDADFHIWAGHPEKNRAWDLLWRTREALVRAGITRESHPDVWGALSSAEGSDWFWWLGDDHFTADKALFDSLFRAHLQAAHERAGLPVPSWVSLPLSGHPRASGEHHEPTALLTPVIDGRLTRYYEWHGAGFWRLGTGGAAMHRVTQSLASELHWAFDARALYLRLDFAAEELPGADAALVIEVLAPAPLRLRVPALDAGVHVLVREGGSGRGEYGKAVLDELMEVALSFAALGAGPDTEIDLLLHIERGGERVETVPPGQVLRVRVPGPDWEVEHWSA